MGLENHNEQNEYFIVIFSSCPVLEYMATSWHIRTLNDLMRSKDLLFPTHEGRMQC